MIKSKHSPVLKRSTYKPNRDTMDLNFLKTSISVINFYSRCWNSGGLSLMSERLMVTVAVAENAPGCPTISLAWMMTKYWSFVSLSIWEAILMTPRNKKNNTMAYKSHFFLNIWHGFIVKYAYNMYHCTQLWIFILNCALAQLFLYWVLVVLIVASTLYFKAILYIYRILHFL